MLQKKQKLYYYERNIINYKTISYLNSAVLIWPVMTLYYAFKGLNFFEIAVLQSVGSIITIILEVPLGWVSDRYGYSFILRVSALGRVISVLFLIVSDNFKLFLVAEIFSSIATAAQSGTDTALLYDSLIQVGKQDNYSIITAKIRGKQSLIRIVARLLAPLLFSGCEVLPFICSGGIYCIVMALTIRYVSPAQELNEKKKNKSNFSGSFKNKINHLKKYKLFISYSFLSAFILISVSNYSQYISPFLSELGLDIKWLGMILSLASIGDYIGTKFVKQLKKLNQNRVLLLGAILISGIVMLGGMGETAISATMVYFSINLIYSPFAIILGENLNRVIDNKYRATLLSISSLLDEMFAICIDPIIGIAIDLLGFRATYIRLGLISIIVLMLTSVLIIKRKYTKND